MIHVYGIPNCISVRKSLAFFEAKKAEVTFHNFKKEALSPADLDAWLAVIPDSVLLNRRGQTWRKVSPEVRDAAEANPQALRALLLDMPGLIKRPVVVFPNGQITVGADEAAWEANLS